MIGEVELTDRASVSAQVEHMRRYFATGWTLPVEARRQALMRLKATLKRNEDGSFAHCARISERARSKRTPPSSAWCTGDRLLLQAHEIVGASSPRSDSHRPFPVQLESASRAIRRGSRAESVELPAPACARAARRRHRGGQLRRRQTLPNLSRDRRAARRAARRGVSVGGTSAHFRLGGHERMAARREVGPRVLHGKPCRGSYGDGFRGGQADACGARVGREEPLHRR